MLRDDAVGKAQGGAERPQKCSQKWPGGVRGRLWDPNPWDGDAQEPLPSEKGRAGAGTGDIVENQLIQPRREGLAWAGASRGLLQERGRFGWLETPPSVAQQRPGTLGGGGGRPCGEEGWPGAPGSSSLTQKPRGGEGLSKDPPKHPRLTQDPCPMSLNWDHHSNPEAEHQTTVPWCPAFSWH